MKLSEASKRLNEISEIPFSKLFSKAELANIKRNKGKAGQLLELALGMELSNGNLDFEDGELKSNKCDASGNPLETVFVTQISSMFDELVSGVPFESTRLYRKIDNILYVPVCKFPENSPELWMFLPSIHIDLTNPRFSFLREIWKNDYISICQQFRQQLDASPTATLHTANGVHLQVRTKDSAPYHPIFSSVYGRQVSNKNRAFYFQKQFVYDIRRIAADK